MAISTQPRAADNVLTSHGGRKLLQRLVRKVQHVLAIRHYIDDLKESGGVEIWHGNDVERKHQSTLTKACGSLGAEATLLHLPELHDTLKDYCGSGQKWLTLFTTLGVALKEVSHEQSLQQYVEAIPSSKGLIGLERLLDQYVADCSGEFHKAKYLFSKASTRAWISWAEKRGTSCRDQRSHAIILKLFDNGSKLRVLKGYLDAYFVLSYDRVQERLIDVVSRLRAVFNVGWFFEWPSGRHPLNSTWPWADVKPSLLVLWGVCWMFNPMYNGFSHPNHWWLYNQQRVQPHVTLGAPQDNTIFQQAAIRRLDDSTRRQPQPQPIMHLHRIGMGRRFGYGGASTASSYSVQQQPYLNTTAFFDCTSNANFEVDLDESAEEHSRFIGQSDISRYSVYGLVPETLASATVCQPQQPEDAHRRHHHNHLHHSNTSHNYQIPQEERAVIGTCAESAKSGPCTELPRDLDLTKSDQFPNLHLYNTSHSCRTQQDIFEMPSSEISPQPFTYPPLGDLGTLPDTKPYMASERDYPHIDHEYEHQHDQQDGLNRYPSPPAAGLSENPYAAQQLADATSDGRGEMASGRLDSSPPPSPGRSKAVPKPQREVTKLDNGRFYCDWPNCTEEIKDFGRKCEWSKHMDKHDRPYKCLADGCEKLPGFTYSGGLLRHQREVHGQHGGPRKQLNCPHENCKRHTGKGFSRQENLNEHLRRVHTIGEVPAQNGEDTETEGGEARAGVKRKRTGRATDEERDQEVAALRQENQDLRRQIEALTHQATETMRQIMQVQQNQLIAGLQRPTASTQMA